MRVARQEVKPNWKTAQLENSQPENGPYDASAAYSRHRVPTNTVAASAKRSRLQRPRNDLDSAR